MPGAVHLELPAHAPALVPDLGLEHLERVLALVVPHAQAAVHRLQLAKRRAQRAPLQGAAADARSIPRPKRAQ